MGIADLFRPKYRHSDVKVRLEAVRALTSDESDILAAVARTDREPAVRRIAIEKLDAADVLAAIAKEERDRALRDLAGARAAALWVTVACQGDAEAADAALEGLIGLGDQRALVEVTHRAEREAVRDRALAALDDPRALAELAKTTTRPALRGQALARIDDPDVLGAIALDTTVKELGIAAIERVEEEDLLEKIAQKAKNKAIRQRARKKLDDLAEARAAAAPRTSDAARRRRAEQAQLLREVEAVVETHEWEKSLAIVTGAEEEWKRLAGADDPAIEERFARAVARYHARRRVAVEQTEAQRAVLEEKRRAAAEEAARRPVAAPVAPEAAAEPVAEARPPEKAEKAEKRKPAEPDPEAVARKAEAEERGKQIAASLDALVGELQAMAASTDARAIDRLLGQAAKAFEQASKVPGEQRRALEERYHQARAQLVIRIQELREAEDWQRWANVPRAEALLKEALALQEAEAPSLDQLKDLQGRWKALGAMPRKKSQELWEQFKAATDAAFAKIKAGRAQQQEKHAAIAAAKEALIVEAERLAESTDWDATAAQMKDLQARWKESGGLPRKQGDALWKRFRAACDRFFERRKPHLEANLAEQQANLEAKQALCERAEAVVAAAPAPDWGASIREIRQLQDRWKEIGFVPRKDADAIYQRFRAACDGLFAKRDAARDAEADARRADVDAARDEIAAIAALGNDPDVARALAVRARVRELAARELDAPLGAMLKQVVEANPAAVQGTELDPEAMRARREKVLHRAEELLPKERPTLDPSLPPDQLAAALKSAMAQNALGDFRGAGRDPFEAVDELRAAWAEIGPVVGEASEALERRFDDVCARVLAAAEADGRRRPEARDDRPPRADRRRRNRDRAAAPAAAAASLGAPEAVAPEAPPPAPEAPPADADVDAGWD